MAAILADDIFKCIFMNENFCILSRISRKIVPGGAADNKTVFVQVMARRQSITWTMLTQYMR